MSTQADRAEVARLKTEYRATTTAQKASLCEKKLKAAIRNGKVRDAAVVEALYELCAEAGILDTFNREYDRRMAAKECTECGGTGEQDCPECGGTGSVECGDCHGTGEETE